MNTEFTTIDSTDLDTVTGGRGKLIQKGAELAKKGGKWAWDNVIKPGAAWAGFDWAVDKATGGGQQQQAPAQPGQ